MADIEISEGVAALPRDEWNALVGDGSPFLEWEWLASLEEAGAVGGRTGWDSRPLVVREAGKLVAACPLYLKSHSEGEFVFDWGWADAAHRAGIEYYPKMLVGVPFTPVAGARFLVAPGADAAHWTERLSAGLRDTCLGQKLSGVHVNFCQREESERMAEQGYLRRLGIQYHWSNKGYSDFEDYLQRFRSKRRNQIRRERREMEKQRVRIETLSGDQISDSLFDNMFGFYLSTIQNRFYGRQYLNRSFFELLNERFRSRLVFVVAFQDDEPIAGTFNVAKGDAMYGRYWGATRPLRHLHFNVCYYAAVEHCIRVGIQRFEPGAGGDYKQLRGFDAQPTWSCHFLSEPRLAEAVSRFLDAERDQAEETIGWLREQSALK